MVYGVVKRRRRMWRVFWRAGLGNKRTQFITWIFGFTAFPILLFAIRRNWLLFFFDFFESQFRYFFRILTILMLFYFLFAFPWLAVIFLYELVNARLSADSDHVRLKMINLTLNSRVTPLLLAQRASHPFFAAAEKSTIESRYALATGYFKNHCYMLKK